MHGIKIKNPLTVLAVKGYSEEAKIDSCDIKVYLFSDLEDDELIEFCKKRRSQMSFLHYGCFRKKDCIFFNGQPLSCIK